ncbi:MAG: GntR family transcriptional regulator [Desulfobacterales bacterium]|jgi:DNA-binding GntR family transcriptional regulator
MNKLNQLSSLQSVDTPPSMQEIAFQAIKQAIMRRELLPGNIYSEQAIAKEMGMSKTPVHQALLDLENKGFVTIFPRKGFKVNTLSAKNIRDMFELRRTLERTVVLKIAPRLTAEEIRDLGNIVHQIEQSRDPIDFQKHDRAFHRYLASLSNNTYIITALNTVWDLSDWVGANILYNWGGFSQAAGEHLAVYELLTAGEAEKAAAAMERHLNGTESRFLKKFVSKRHDEP